MPSKHLPHAFLYLSSLAFVVNCGGDAVDEGPVSTAGTAGVDAAQNGAGQQGGGAGNGAGASSSTAGANASTSGSGATGNVSGSGATGGGMAGNPGASGSGTLDTAAGAGTAGSAPTAGTANDGQGGTGAGGAPVDNPINEAGAMSAGAAGAGPDIDENGKMNATPGESTAVAQDYLRLGEIRILNNNWGSEDLGCTEPTSTMSVFVNDDQTFGWNFSRGDCAAPTDSSHPDFPQLEFGIHPFGIGSPLATSPEFSSTTLLPLQIKNITSASVSVDNLNIALQNQSSWNLTAEFWLSERDPVNDPNPGVYAEVMTWWGWDQGRWPCELNNDMTPDYGVDMLSAGSLQYSLCHQSDTWADGWRYYQFRAGDASDNNISNSFSGDLDVKALLDYLVNQRGYSQDLWVTRIEVGSEIDDDTSGTVSMRGVTFEVNGESRSQVIGVQ